MWSLSKPWSFLQFALFVPLETGVHILLQGRHELFLAHRDRDIAVVSPILALRQQVPGPMNWKMEEPIIAGLDSCWQHCFCLFR